MIAAQSVNIYRIPLESATLDHGVLDVTERDRARRFLRADDRRRFVVAHAATRIVLGRLLDKHPAAIEFTGGHCGKPRLVCAATDIRFNLSHSGGLALLAVAVGREVGVDIERQRPIDPVALADHVFSAPERRALRTLSPHDRSAAFFRGWVRKESFVKALGDGLSFPLHAFDVSLDSAVSQALLRCRRDTSDVSRWIIMPLPAEEGYAAALTVEAQYARLMSCECPKDPFRPYLIVSCT